MSTQDLTKFIIEVSGYVVPFVDWLRKEIDSAELHRKLEEALEGMSKISQQLEEIKRLQMYGDLNAAVNLIQDSTIAIQQDTVLDYRRDARSILYKIAKSDADISSRVRAIAFFWLAYIASSNEEPILLKQYMFSLFCYDPMFGRMQLAAEFYKRELKMDVEEQMKTAIDRWYIKERDKLKEKDYRIPVYREITVDFPRDPSRTPEGSNYYIRNPAHFMGGSVFDHYEELSPEKLNAAKRHDLERLENEKMNRLQNTDEKALDEICRSVACRNAQGTNMSIHNR